MLDPLARKSSLFELSFVQNLTDSTLNCRFVLGIGFFKLQNRCITKVIQGLPAS